MIKKLSHYIGEYKKETILTPILVTLEVIMEIVIPLLMAELIDKGIDKGDMNGIDVYKRQALYGCPVRKNIRRCGCAEYSDEGASYGKVF